MHFSPFQSLLASLWGGWGWGSLVRRASDRQCEHVGGGVPVAADQADLDHALAVRERAVADGGGSSGFSGGSGRAGRRFGGGTALAEHRVGERAGLDSG